jgi:hypothetical protein
MNKKRRCELAIDFHFTATGIGSVPSLDVEGTCRHILQNFPEMPFWPQFVRRSPFEDMRVQFSEGLPFLKVQGDGKSLTASGASIEAELVEFYERFLAEDIDYFSISREYAPGLYRLVEIAQQSSDHYGPFIKGQSVGPVTLGAAVTDHTGKSVLYNPDLLEALGKGLAIKALWQVNKLRETGKRPVIFLDEPYLTGFGSAFTAIQRHEVIHLLKEVIDYLKAGSDALIGIHCCGNTDWPMLIETGPDIINFDASDYMESFLLYPEEIMSFLQAGGSIAWGIVPTFTFSGRESVADLYTRLQKGIEKLQQWGIDAATVASRSILTPACGTGTISLSFAEQVLDYLSLLSNKCRDAGKFQGR